MVTAAPGTFCVFNARLNLGIVPVDAWKEAPQRGEETAWGMASDE